MTTSTQMLTPFAIPSTSQPSNPLTLSPPSSARADTRASPTTLAALAYYPSITTRHRPIAVRSVAGATQAHPHNDSAESLSWPLQLAYRSNQSSYRRSDHRRAIVGVPTPHAPCAHPTSAQAFLTSTTQTGRQPELSSAAPAHDGPVLIQSSSSTLPTRCRSHRYHPRARLGGDSTGRALPPPSVMRPPTPSGAASAALCRAPVGYRERHHLPSQPSSALVPHSPGLGPCAGRTGCTLLRVAAALLAPLRQSRPAPPSRRPPSSPTARGRSAAKLRGDSSHTPTAPADWSAGRPEASSSRRQVARRRMAAQP